MARQIGAAFDDDVHHHVAWTPVSLVPQPDGSRIGFPHFNDRAKPGFIVVDKGGRRFANETASIRDLARRFGIDPDGLARTIDSYNPLARDGKDPEFGRGSDAFQRVHGAAHERGPNPNVAPIDKAPLYALRIIPGDIGTLAGIKTDEFARSGRAK
jgi:hypothetical protein